MAAGVNAATASATHPQILGVGVIAGHPPCTPVELVEQRGRVALKPGRQLRVALIHCRAVRMCGLDDRLVEESVVNVSDVQRAALPAYRSRRRPRVAGPGCPSSSHRSSEPPTAEQRRREETVADLSRGGLGRSIAQSYSHSPILDSGRDTGKYLFRTRPTLGQDRPTGLDHSSLHRGRWAQWVRSRCRGWVRAGSRSEMPGAAAADHRL
jgi:hypothetical protein